MTARRGVAAALATAALAVALPACGGSDDSDPQPSDVPSNAIAVIGDAQIGKDELTEQIAVLRRATPPAKGEAAEAAETQLERQALDTLLRAEALEQEAAERGIEVSVAEARERWQSAARAQFRTKRALRRFLGRQTVSDVVAQLRLQMLAEGIAEQVSEEAGGGKKGAQAVKEFQQDFQQRWRDRTACREGSGASGLCADAE